MDGLREASGGHSVNTFVRARLAAAHAKKTHGFKVRFESFRKLGVPYFGVLIKRILLFGVLYWVPYFRKLPFQVNFRKKLQEIASGDACAQACPEASECPALESCKKLNPILEGQVVLGCRVLGPINNINK